ncbi:MAG: hypothetical protein A2577_02800 [Bdellovibrionales bacterium RIFOXYD1_FULL_36_51]|nr:MAG: hypothetical protein A2417_11190 [Bdellovibrionales bacterium RIFOXYC1_FULL_37_79]OFZ62335.1 MAG: hypothetical protein A2577_02800 [Bdellovibrionales bacterium RIFOXYD1_FULL_36_51]
MQRIVIIGSSSSGKTTLGALLSKKLLIEHKELDFFFWKSNWQESDFEEFRQKVDAFTRNDKWIVDGNYLKVKDLTWKRATDIIWLDYSLPIILKRFFIRSLTRSLKREVLWNGNVETFKNNLFSTDSLLIWIFKTFFKNRKTFLALKESDEFSNIRFHHFKRPSELKNFLNLSTWNDDYEPSRN